LSVSKLTESGIGQSRFWGAMGWAIEVERLIEVLQCDFQILSRAVFRLLTTERLSLRWDHRTNQSIEEPIAIAIIVHSRNKPTRITAAV
jgi:hypothetical protein